MQIKSKIKDYYDYVAGIYGGGDPSIKYIRSRIGEISTRYGEPQVQSVTIKTLEAPVLQYVGKLTSCLYNHHTGFVHLCVAGRVFPIFDIDHAQRPHYYNLNYSDGKHVVFDPAKHANHVKQRGLVEYNPNWQSRPIEDSIVRISRELGHPVFIITGINKNWKSKELEVFIDGNCPILSTLGLAPYFPAEQLYQELSYFIVNLMKDSPDMMPIPKPPMTDKERIVSHGFDLKASFRHRK